MRSIGIAAYRAEGMRVTGWAADHPASQRAQARMAAKAACYLNLNANEIVPALVNAGVVVRSTT